MNPQSTEHTGLSLPSPVPEQAPAGAVATKNPTSPLESVTGAAEQSMGVTPAGPTAAISLPFPAAGGVADPMATAAPAIPSSGVAVADDGDLIEKEWVSKAKKIVEQTREDPHEQSKELTVFKADYMQKRYNKIIKLSE